MYIDQVLRDVCKENGEGLKNLLNSVFLERCGIPVSFQKFSLLQHKRTFLYAFGVLIEKSSPFNSVLLVRDFPNEISPLVICQQRHAAHFLEERYYNAVMIFGLKNGQIWAPKENGGKIFSLLQGAFVKTTPEAKKFFGLPVFCEDVRNLNTMGEQIRYSALMVSFLKEAISHVL